MLHRLFVDAPARPLRCLTGWLCLLFVTLGNVAGAQLRETPTGQLLTQLSDSNVDTRRDAAYELVRRGADSPEVVGALGKALADDDTQVRFQALLGLARAGEKAQAAIPELLICLNNRSPQVRFRAADALGKIGIAALPGLCEQLSQGRELARVAAANALAHLGPAAEAAVPQLAEALEFGEGELQLAAAEALAAILPRKESALLAMSRHGNAGVRRVGVAALAALPAPSAEVAQALREACSDEDAQLREAALLALAKSSVSDEERAARIESALVDEAEAVRAAAFVALRKAKLDQVAFAERLAARLQTASGSEAEFWVRGLTALGSSARRALPSLLDAVRKHSLTPELVADALASLGPTAVPELLAALQQQPQLETPLATALARIGEPALPTLTRGLTSEHEVVRRTSTRALGAFPALDEEQSVQLLAALSDVSPAVRALAATAVAANGRQLPTATAGILQATEDSTPEVRAAALAVLPQLELSAAQKKQALTRGLADTAAAVRAASLLAVIDLPDVEPYREPLLRLGSDEDSEVRQLALAALGKLDQETLGEPLVDLLATALADGQPTIRLVATETVKSLGATDARLLPSLAANLAGDSAVRLASLEALEGWGKQASAVVPAVVELRNNKEAAVRSAAVQTLAAIDADIPHLVGELRAALADADWDVRRVAAESLGQLGPAAEAAVPQLFGMLANEEDSDFASSALRGIDAAPLEALSLLSEQLDSKDGRTSAYAIFLLGKLGAQATEILPRLEKMLQDTEAGKGGIREKYLKQAIAAIKGE